MDTETTAAVQQAQAVSQQIRRYNRQYAAGILLLALKTVLPPFVTLLVMGLLSAYVVGYVSASAGSRLFTAAASAITFLVSILAARAVWQWADRRYRGWTVLRTVGQVNRDLRQLERDIQAAEITGAERILAMAQAAWESYAAAMRAAGFVVQ